VTSSAAGGRRFFNGLRLRGPVTPQGGAGDEYAQWARREGYLSRAAYKLEQILEDHRIMAAGDTVVDLGAAPGGWSQVTRERVGPEGTVIAVDQRPIEAEDVTVIRGDITETETLRRISEAANMRVDAVISDMSPKISGNYSMDHARSVHLAELALDTAHRLLDEGGGFLCKVFRGDLFMDYYEEVGEAFDFHKSTSPDASRDESSETYVVGERYRG